MLNESLVLVGFWNTTRIYSSLMCWLGNQLNSRGGKWMEVVFLKKLGVYDLYSYCISVLFMVKCYFGKLESF